MERLRAKYLRGREDWLPAFEPFETYDGGPGDDVYNGTAFADIANGNGGNDQLNGLGGDDILNGGDGNDGMNGGDGNDTILGGNGADVLNGDGGDDTLILDGQTGFGFADTAHGVLGSDRLVLDWSATAGHLQMGSGPTPNATFGGFDGNFTDVDSRNVNFTSIEHFTIRGGVNNDIVTTATGNDDVQLGLGDDFVNIGSGTDVADGGGGTDGISADLSSATVAILWNLQTNTYAGPAGTSFANFEYFGTLTTGSGNDVIVTTNVVRSEVINLGDGDDSATVVQSQPGGGETVNGGNGSDRLIIDWSTTAVNAANNTGPTANAVLGGFDGQFTDSVNVQVAYTSIEHFTITTGAGSDNLTTGSGNDIVSLGSNNDFVNVGSGIDQGDGGDGEDGISADMSSATAAILWNLNTSSFSGIAGASFTNFEFFGTLTTGSGNDIIVTTNAARNETINLGDGNDSATVFASASGGDDNVNGGSGSDRLIVDYSTATGNVTNNSGPTANGALGGFDGKFNIGSTSRSVGYSSIEHFTITTGSGNDNLTVASGNDIISLGLGDDFIDVGSGVDQADGGDGEDGVSADMSSATGAILWNLQTNGFSGIAGASFTSFEFFGTLTTGSGNDVIVTTSAARNETINLGDGDDSASVDGSTSGNSDRVNGGNGSDRLIIDWSTETNSVRNISGPTVNAGLGGFDGTYGPAGTFKSVVYTSIEHFTITGGSGDDIFTTAGGSDRLTGRLGADDMDGGGGADTFAYLATAESTTGARDRIRSFETGVDKIDLAAAGATAVAWTEVTDGTGTWNRVTVQTPGGEMEIRVDGALALSDFILAAGGPINGTPGPDILQGTAGDDVINGLGDNDTINGLAGSDTLNGGDGNDGLDGGDGADLMSGGTGNDVFVVDNAGDEVTELSGEGNDRLLARSSFGLAAGSEVELLAAYDLAGTGGLDLSGNELAQIIIGNAGANNLFGLAGADALYGLGGNDSLDGGTGGDAMFGGAGDDIYAVDNLDDQAIEAAGQGNDRVLATISFALGVGSEIELLSAYNQAGTGALDFTGNELAQIIIGNDGVNSLYGLAGNDTLYGLGGNDSLDGGAGGDTMLGGAGDDTYVVDDAGDQAIEAAGGGNDRVLANASFQLGAGSEVELLAAYDLGGTGALDLTGNELAQILIGNAGVNALGGGGGNDTLQGLEGSDVLDGGLGSDVLIGGAGADLLVFTTALGGGNIDQIVGFTSGTDGIALFSAVFTGLAPGSLPAGAFVAGTAAQDADDRIIYNPATGALFFDADGNGAGAAVQFAVLQGAPALAASDFSVI